MDLESANHIAFILTFKHTLSHCDELVIKKKIFMKAHFCILFLTVIKYVKKKNK